VQQQGAHGASDWPMVCVQAPPPCVFRRQGMSRDVDVGRRDEAIKLTRSGGRTHGGAVGMDAWWVGLRLRDDCLTCMWVQKEAWLQQEIVDRSQLNYLAWMLRRIGESQSRTKSHRRPSRVGSARSSLHPHNYRRLANRSLVGAARVLPTASRRQTLHYLFYRQ
jgi:hypothetical protein